MSRRWLRPPDAALRKLEARLGGRIGLAALDTASGKTLSWRADERFAMCSSFKWLLAAAILARVDQGKLTLDLMVPYTAKALLAHSPVTSAHLSEGGMTVRRAVRRHGGDQRQWRRQSAAGKDRRSGGLYRLCGQIGDTVTRLDRNEPSLNDQSAG